MIDLNKFYSAADALKKRTGILIALYDAQGSLMLKTGDFYMSAAVSRKSQNSSHCTVYICDSQNVPISEAYADMIMLYLEVFLKDQGIEAIMSGAISGQYSQDAVIAMISNSKINSRFNYRLYMVSCEQDQYEDISYIVKEILDTSSGDVLIPFGENAVIFIKKCDYDNVKYATELAEALIQSIGAEIRAKNMHVSFSGIYANLAEAANAYKECYDTMRVGVVCYPSKTVYAYENMQTENFINMVPRETLHKFYVKNATENIKSAWDDKMIQTVQVLFDNSLNLSTTSRELFTHRNTLVYRLEKIKKISGLDLKRFDDAVMFKILMVIDCFLTNEDK